MADWDKILLTAFGSFVVFVLGQIFVRFFAEPVLEVRKLIGEIAFVLLFYAPIYTNPPVQPPTEKDMAQRDEARRALREKPFLLSASARAVLGYDVFAKFHLLPSREQVERAGVGLAKLANSVYEGDPNRGARLWEEIEVALGLPRSQGRQQGR